MQPVQLIFLTHNLFEVVNVGAAVEAMRARTVDVRCKTRKCDYLKSRQDLFRINVKRILSGFDFIRGC